MTRKRYECVADEFWIEDPLLGLSLYGQIERFERIYDPDIEVLLVETGRKGEKLHGPSCYYAKTGQLLSKSWFFEGVSVGEHTRYYDTGELYGVERFVEGKAHLTQEYYYKNGEVKTTYSYCHGKLEGRVALFWPHTAKLKRELLFAEGEKLQDTLFDERGNVIAEMARALSRN